LNCGGDLSQRILIRTGDELEALGDQFNSMAVQLQDSYATLERKVEDRTRELAQSVEELRTLGEVSQAVNSTLDLEHVLDTIVAKAVQLSGTDAGTIYVFFGVLLDPAFPDTQSTIADLQAAARVARSSGAAGRPRAAHRRARAGRRKRSRAEDLRFRVHASACGLGLDRWP
jgi:nitrogen fixation/metabolism regulation signal transduction histidine kinase